MTTVAVVAPVSLVLTAAHAQQLRAMVLNHISKLSPSSRRRLNPDELVNDLFVYVSERVRTAAKVLSGEIPLDKYVSIAARAVMGEKVSEALGFRKVWKTVDGKNRREFVPFETTFTDAGLPMSGENENEENTRGE